ncbi:Type 1 glutamine amidotransferase-like domain-containing protein [Clostridium sp.]|uniref:Type 1 glutamine amidotransferase-like domain-containing protein n=1 Tax=Clostridium sp. TaxID=1506 RepID=UPI0026021454|nr:Type 1 glutamine amidotransferase-like domain-containing protein [Clostridium sp.]
MKALLTSTGLENDKFKKIILEWTKTKKEKKAIFIPTAAIFPDAIEVLPKCLDDLLNLDIKKDNIFVYDLFKKVLAEELLDYDIIYICGGNTQYLLDRINYVEFNLILKELLDKGKVMVGVSAGSIIAAQNKPNNLGLVNCMLNVHCEIGSPIGTIDQSKLSTVNLSNSQAILIDDNVLTIIE